MSERPDVDPIDYLLADLHRILCGEGVHMGPCPNPLAEQVLKRPSTRIWLERVVSEAEQRGTARAYDRGYGDGVKAARDAVDSVVDEVGWRTVARAAIDALEKS
jgi:hypothetical protein